MNNEEYEELQEISEECERFFMYCWYIKEHFDEYETHDPLDFPL